MKFDQIKNDTRTILSKIINLPIFVQGKIKHGYNFRTYGRIIIKGKANRISFGDGCIIRSGIATNPLGGSRLMIFALGAEGKIECGNNVGISNSCIRINTKLIIEDFVNIGGDCKIYDSDMHSVKYEWRVQSPDTHVKMSQIHIMEGAWIGAHSIILKGVTIGKHSVVGAGSVVTKDIPSYQVWGGNPARFIKNII